MTLIVAVVATLFTLSCKNTTQSSCCSKTHAENLLYTAKEWKAYSDQLGSSFSPSEMVVVDSLIEVDFTLKKKEEGEIVFIELVCDIGDSLAGKQGLELTYKCETDLLVKLSQSDFGGEGDQSYAHYQFRLPASESLTTAKLTFAEFTQPAWAPDASKGFPLKLENVRHIYLTPAVPELTGGSALLGIKALYLK